MGNRHVIGLLTLAVVAACSERTIPSAPEEVSAFNALADAATSAAPQSELVLTPEGWYHRSCVHEVPNGAHVDFRTSMVTRPDGTTYQVGRCLFPGRRNAHGVRVSAPVNNGWIEYAEDHSSLGAGHWFGSVTARWTVPSKPAGSYSSSQAYFTFPGIQSPSIGYIIQPVLQYGWAGDSGGHTFGGNFWSAASWRCNYGSDCYYSAPITSIDAGDEMLGTVTASNCANGRCTWTIIARDLTKATQSTKIVASDTADYRFADGAVVEVYALTSCNQYPRTGVFYNSIGLFNENGVGVTPIWSNVVTWGLDPECDFNVTSASSTVSLYHNPPPMYVYLTGPSSGDPYSDVTISANVLNGTPPYTYAWTIDGVSACGNSASCTGRLGDAGTFTDFSVEVADANLKQAGSSKGVYACPPRGNAPCY